MRKKSNMRLQHMAENYIQSNISRCPICNCPTPDWEFSHISFLRDKKIQYRCSTCNCLLSTDYGDLKGVGGNTLSEFLQGASSYDAMVRSVYKKKKNTLYIRILDPGIVSKASELKGQELPLDELTATIFRNIPVQI